MTFARNDRPTRVTLRFVPLRTTAVKTTCTRPVTGTISPLFRRRSGAFPPHLTGLPSVALHRTHGKQLHLIHGPASRATRFVIWALLWRTPAWQTTSDPQNAHTYGSQAFRRSARLLPQHERWRSFDRFFDRSSFSCIEQACQPGEGYTQLAVQQSLPESAATAVLCRLSAQLRARQQPTTGSAHPCSLRSTCVYASEALLSTTDSRITICRAVLALRPVLLGPGIVSIFPIVHYRVCHDVAERSARAGRPTGFSNCTAHAGTPWKLSVSFPVAILCLSSASLLCSALCVGSAPVIRTPRPRAAYSHTTISTIILGGGIELTNTT